MNQALLEAIKRQAEKQTIKTVKLSTLAKKKESTPPTPEKIKVTIERVFNTQRLRLIFSTKPYAETLAAMNRITGKFYEPDTKFWTFPDTPLILERLNEILEPYEIQKNDRQNATPLKDQVPADTLAPTSDQVVSDHSEFSKYCRQIDEIKEKTGLDLQTILYASIDLYHRENILD